MTPDPWNSFATALGTLGPVGVFALAGWFLWLRYGRPALPLNNAQEHRENTGRLDELRDVTRDTQSMAERIILHEEREMPVLLEIASQQKQTVDVLSKLVDKVTWPSGARR
jgi:hypothetical protein